MAVEPAAIGLPATTACSGSSNWRVGVAPMRLKENRGFRGIAVSTCMALVLCVFTPEAVASDLISTMPSLWAAATALSLMLVTVVSANQK
jgi:hypothetical protein